MASKPPVSRFVVGVDGSAGAAEALEQATRLARATGAEIVAVHAMENTHRLTHAGLYGLRDAPPRPGQSRVAEVHGFVRHWCRPLEESGVSYRTIVESGSPALVIQAVAERIGADLVVVGRRGRGALAGFVLGSVSSRLAHTCRLPLLLVSLPPEARTREPARAGSRTA
ncbi:MAG TPA: universal stress protein [Candidatus Dormibacteraeota bacterium]|nr:universal stress protein [Candidatus Dormibacteraeota bacterium]